MENFTFCAVINQGLSLTYKPNKKSNICLFTLNSSFFVFLRKLLLLFVDRLVVTQSLLLPVPKLLFFTALTVNNSMNITTIIKSLSMLKDKISYP